jgi:ubiquinone biosynthesis protein UbiJ
MRRLDLDWEEELSRWLGDSLARKLGNLGRRSARVARESVQTLAMDLSEYLRFEKQALPDRTEVDEFNADVDTLRNDVERLKARINRLQARDRS